MVSGDIQGDIHERDEYAIGPFHEDIGLNNQGRPLSNSQSLLVI